MVYKKQYKYKSLKYYTMSELFKNDDEDYSDMPELISVEEEEEYPGLMELYEDDLNYCEKIKDEMELAEEAKTEYNALMCRLEKEGTQKCIKILPNILDDMLLNNVNSSTLINNENKDEILNSITQIMRDGTEEFTKITGRNMTYLEMRSLYG